MEENLTNMFGALFWLILAPIMIWKPEKIISPVNKIYHWFSRIVTPFPPKDSYFEFRPQTAILTRIIASILFCVSAVGFYLNLLEIIHRR